MIKVNYKMSLKKDRMWFQIVLLDLNIEGNFQGSIQAIKVMHFNPLVQEVNWLQKFKAIVVSFLIKIIFKISQK